MHGICSFITVLTTAPIDSPRSWLGITTATINSRHETTASPLRFGTMSSERYFDISKSDISVVEMTGDQSRLLTIGDRICWGAKSTDLGTVTRKNWSGVSVKWDDRSEQAILHNDMAQVERVRKS